MSIRHAGYEAPYLLELSKIAGSGCDNRPIYYLIEWTRQSRI